MSAGIFNRVEPSKADQPLINTDFPAYNFDVIDGVSYKIDLSQASKYDPKGVLLDGGANRIKDLSFQGQAVAPAQDFVVVSNNYRAGGGGNFPEINESKVIFEAPDTNRDVIVRYIVEKGTIDPAADRNWSFASMPGASVLFDTGPGAKAFLREVKGVTIEPAGEGEGGFARYRISL